ncbi:MAG: hypothetical protein WBK28_02520 [Minisyncoccia bacterium]
MKGPGALHVFEGGNQDNDMRDLSLAEKFIQAYAIDAAEATQTDKTQAPYKIVRELDPMKDTWEDLYFLRPGTDAEFTAGKIAQLINKIGGRLEVRRVEKANE